MLNKKLSSKSFCVSFENSEQFFKPLLYLISGICVNGQIEKSINIFGSEIYCMA